MSKFKLLLVFIMCMAVGYATFGSAATTLRRIGEHPFYRTPLKSESDLQALVKNRSADLKTGFAEAGEPDLYPAFMEQFPTAKIDSIKVSPGETFPWMLFKRNGTGKVAVAKDLTWGGAAAIDAYRFDIAKGGKNYEMVIPLACGNVALRNVAPIPPPAAPKPVTIAPPPSPPATPKPVTAVPSPAPEVTKPVALAPPPSPPATPRPVAAAAPPPEIPQPVALAPPPSPPLTPKPVPVMPATAPAATIPGGLILDVGLSRLPDPANYAFVHVGYELPLTENLYLMGLVGGYVRWMGDDGGHSFTADAMLDYHWLKRLSLGVGAGYWTGEDGWFDLIADAGYRLYGDPSRSNTELFLEWRSPFDDLAHFKGNDRYGMGVRFRF